MPNDFITATSSIVLPAIAFGLFLLGVYAMWKLHEWEARITQAKASSPEPLLPSFEAYGRVQAIILGEEADSKGNLATTFKLGFNGKTWVIPASVWNEPNIGQYVKLTGTGDRILKLEIIESETPLVSKLDGTD